MLHGDLLDGAVSVAELRQLASLEFGLLCEIAAGELETQAQANLREARELSRDASDSASRILSSHPCPPTKRGT